MKHCLRAAALALALGLGVCAIKVNASAAALMSPGSPALLAAEAPESGSQTEMILEIINFVLLLAALGYFLRKPAKNFFAERAASTRQRLEEGAKALEAARAKLAEVEGRLAGLDQEIAQLKTDAEKNMEAELQRIRLETSEELVKIQKFAQAQISSALRAAKTEMKHFAAREAIEQSRAAIGSRLDETGRRSLVRFFLASLHSSAARN